MSSSENDLESPSSIVSAPTVMESTQPVATVHTEDTSTLPLRQQDFVTTIEPTETTFVDNQKRHYYKKTQHEYPRVFLACTLTTFLTVLGLFLIWVLTTPTGYPWFIAPTYMGVLMIWIFFIAGSPQHRQTRVHSIHTAFYCTTSLFFILLNYAGTFYPWWIWPVGLLTLLIVFHTMFKYFKLYFGLISIHAMIYAVVNFNLFVTWCYGKIWFPWFAIVAFSWYVNSCSVCC